MLLKLLLFSSAFLKKKIKKTYAKIVSKFWKSYLTIRSQEPISPSRFCYFGCTSPQVEVTNVNQICR